MYDFIFLSTRLHFRNHIFKLYDSYTRKELNSKAFEPWYVDVESNENNKENKKILSFIKEIFKKNSSIIEDDIEDIKEDQLGDV